MKKGPSVTVAAFSASDLARALGVSTQCVSINRRKPGAPSLDDIEGWTQFLAENTRTGIVDETIVNQIARQNLKIKEETAKEKARENELAAGELVKFSEVRRYAIEVMSFFYGEHERLRQTLPALLKGRTELEIFTIYTAETAQIDKALRAKLEGMVGK